MPRHPRRSIRAFASPFASTAGGPQPGRLSRAISSRRSRLTRTRNSRLTAAQHRWLLALSRPCPAPSSPIRHSTEDTEPAMPKESKNSVPMPVPWGRLKAWIEAQEKAEQEGHNPQPMTKTQLSAISQIVDFLDGPEPDVSDRDYVSLLMQQVQALRIAPPKYEEKEPVEVPADGVFSLRWRTTCFLPYAGDKEFPCLGHGLYRDRHAPLFKLKKSSKQYAAKHALAYLKRHPPPPLENPSATISIPSSGGAPLRPLAKSSGPSGSNVSIGSSQSGVPQGTTGGARIKSPWSSPSSSTGDVAKADPLAGSKSEPMTPDNEFYDNERLPSILEQVTQEALRLGIGCPQYEIGPDPDEPGAFAGRPVFKNGGRIPADMGHVKGARSKGLAKELMAEAVLKFLRLELKRRQGILGSFQSKDSSSEKEKEKEVEGS
ncbi:hypothetical protein TARUN_2287 [Trichoderma arundinaceum]|uniref:DRBM domain-containing protein n=1 Tax=Trichoderma arundinaceum TaxID=490622 RepID=A0A395NVC2_TRIAR|nr:hypothetical protein TARUN_2287 [Trichoderma arundinaceum]